MHYEHNPELANYLWIGQGINNFIIQLVDWWWAIQLEAIVWLIFLSFFSFINLGINCFCIIMIITYIIIIVAIMDLLFNLMVALLYLLYQRDREKTIMRLTMYSRAIQIAS